MDKWSAAPAVVSAARLVYVGISVTPRGGEDVDLSVELEAARLKQLLPTRAERISSAGLVWPRRPTSRGGYQVQFQCVIYMAIRPTRA